jgi:putative salt-induced outer membrane protein YdiY
MTFKRIFLAFDFLLFVAVPAAAQVAEPALPPCACPCPCPEPPPPSLQGSLSAGLALTSGNTDTSSFNLGFNLVYDPKTHSLFRADAFYLRSANNGAATTDKAAANLRFEYGVTDRTYAFAQVGYQRDRFKNVLYLITPMAGGGYFLIKQKDFEVTADVSVGGAFESDSGFPATNSGAFSVGQGFAWKISRSATFTEKATGLWKLNHLSDSFYHFEMGLAATITKASELKILYLVDTKNRPNPDTLKKTDTALIAAFVYKF